MVVSIVSREEYVHLTKFNNKDTMSNFISRSLDRFFAGRKRKRAREAMYKEKVKQLEGEYTELLQEYKRIEDRTSLLSRNKQKLVQARVIYLIGRGHIKVNRG